MTTITPYRSQLRPGRDGFGQLVHAEWTKFRTVRGWIIGVVIAVLVAAGLGLLTAGSAQSSCQQASSGGAAGHPRSGAGCTNSGLPVTLGPAGEPVTDSFYFVRQPLTGDGSITARVTSLTGLIAHGQTPQGLADTQPGLEQWAKAGIIIKQNLNQGSAYAAMMAAGGHGVRMQWNYTGDTAGLPGAVGPADPRWLRLTRSGDVITGYDSADGTHWTRVGTVTLPGLPSTVRAGLFTASPNWVESHGGSTSSGGTEATAVFDHLSVSGGRSAGPWTGGYVGGAYSDSGAVGGYRHSGDRFTLTGAGDIAPTWAGHGGPLDSALTVTDFLIGTFAGLIAIAVVASLFITGEYRRKLIRTTLAASPRRGRVLAAKAIVIGAVSFAAGVLGSAAAVLIGGKLTRARGYYEFPVTWQTELRVIIGTGLLVGVAAVLFLAIGAMVRRSAVTVVIAIVAMVVPYFLAVVAAMPAGVSNWVFRITPAAGFASQQPYPAYPQVAGLYVARNGYYPLAPWAGLAVLAGWAAVALAAAVYLLRRRDA